MIADFEIELRTDVSLSNAARTLGAHETLDYVPGRVLWGIAAGRAYAGGMDPGEAFRLFQQGAVRFFDAVPAASGPDGRPRRTAPTPRSWQMRKYGTAVRNFAAPDQREQTRGEQYEPLAPDWRAPDGTVVRIEKRFAMRTAIEAAGRARKGLLFGLESIAAGTRFLARIEGADADVERAGQLLAGECRLGRSRSAEYGLARITRLDHTAATLAEAPDGQASRIAILCLSRLALRDSRTGQPTFEAAPEFFGLDPAVWRTDLASCFVRTARYSPFHQKRGRPETERAVIEPGSVVVFETRAGPPVALAEVREKCACGVGEWRHQGLGEVSVNPEWLTVGEPRIPHAPDPARGDRGAAAAAPPEDELYRWAARDAAERRRAREQFLWAEQNAAAFAAYALPPSQWGMLRALARQARYRPDGPQWLRDEVERLLGRGVRSLSARWGKRVRGRTAADELRELLREKPDELPVRLELLCSRVVRLAAEDAPPQGEAR